MERKGERESNNNKLLCAHCFHYSMHVASLHVWKCNLFKMLHSYEQPVTMQQLKIELETISYYPLFQSNDKLCSI